MLIVAAIISSADWPHDAKLVPLTACGMALVAAVLNLVNELFGREQKIVVHADAGVKVSAHVPDLGVADDVVRGGGRSIFFALDGGVSSAWSALIGFIPAIALFVFAYMCFGFGEPWLPSLGYAAATTLLCLSCFTGRCKSPGRRRCSAICSRRCGRYTHLI